MRLHRRQLAGEIPTSSMADIAFLLIVFFMITMTFAATRGLDVRFPPREEVPTEIDPVEAVLVEVVADGGLRVDRRPMALADLLPYLAPKLERDPAKPVILRPEDGAPYGRMVRVLDVLRRGRQTLGLARDIQVALPTRRETAEFWR